MDERTWTGDTELPTVMGVPHRLNRMVKIDVCGVGVRAPWEVKATEVRRRVLPQGSRKLVADTVRSRSDEAVRVMRVSAPVAPAGTPAAHQVTFVRPESLRAWTAKPVDC